MAKRKKKSRRGGKYCPCPEGTQLVKRSPNTGKRLKRPQCASVSSGKLHARRRARKGGLCYKGRRGVKKSKIISVRGLRGLGNTGAFPGRTLRGCGCSG